MPGQRAGQRDIYYLGAFGTRRVAAIYHTYSATQCHPHSRKSEHQDTPFYNPRLRYQSERVQSSLDDCILSDLYYFPVGGPNFNTLETR